MRRYLGGDGAAVVIAAAISLTVSVPALLPVGNTNWAPTVSDDPAVAMEPPAEEIDEPEDLKAEAVSSSEIRLTWSPPDDAPAIDYYNVYRESESVGRSEDTTFTDSGLDAFTEYSYRVAAVDKRGREGERSDPASATTRDGSPPTAPSNLTAASAGTHQIDLRWTASFDPETGIDHYVVYRDGSKISSVSDTTYSDDSLEPATAYAYQVSAVNGDSLESDRSNEASDTTAIVRDTVPPAPPLDLREVSGS